MLGWLVALCSAEPGQHLGPVDVRPFLESQPSLDPDEPRFEYGTHQRRWRAMAGGQLGLWGFDHPNFRYVLALSGFVELVNFGTYAVPWESFRANIGFNTLWRPNTAWLRSIGANLGVQFGWHHESDHAANVSDYEADFVAPTAAIDNANFSAFEYFKARVDWVQNWGFRGQPRLFSTIAPGIRVFTPSINFGDLRRPILGLQNELRFAYQATPHVRPWIAGFGEWVANRFDASTAGVLPDEGDVTPPAGARPLLTRSLRVGVTVTNRSKTMQLVPQLGYENSNGRGVDFMRRWGHAAAFALTIYR